MARYEWAAVQLPPNSRVLDLACGVGYGAKILADAGHKITAIDRDAEAIDYAREHYAHRNIAHGHAMPADIEFDAVVCFETLEHLDDAPAMLAAFNAPLLLASVPNEEKFRYLGQKFHKRHYTRHQFAELLNGAGWGVTGWWGQRGIHSDLEQDLNGRTVVVTAERGAASLAVPSAGAPEHVAIVGLGPSAKEYFELVKTLGGRNGLCDEVWGINAMGNLIACDRVFHMDDVAVQEARALAKPNGNIAAMVAWLRNHPGPIYTSAVRPGYPGLVAFPLQDVLNNGGVPYLNNTAAYAIAYARHIGVKKLSIYGVDFTVPNMHQGERGRACCEFWLGLCIADGMEIWAPAESTLMDACAPDDERLYGFDGFDVLFTDADDGSLVLTFEEKALPTAEEIEARYDHSRHVNRILDKEQ